MRRQASPPGVATVSRFALVAGLGALGSFIALSALVAAHDVWEWEDRVVFWVVDLPEWLLILPRALMHISTRFTIPILALAAYGVTLRWRAASTVLFACVVAAFPVWLAKHMVSRPRPSGVPARDDFYGSGYASGHMTIAIAAAAAVTPYLLTMPRRRGDRPLHRAKHIQGGPMQFMPERPRWVLGTIPFLMALGVGLARIYVGAHFPLDLAGGALAGFAGAWLVLALPHFQPHTQSSIDLLPASIQGPLKRLAGRLTSRRSGDGGRPEASISM